MTVVENRVVLMPCADYGTHEWGVLNCHHANKNVRFNFYDGCSVEVCDRCMYRVPPGFWDDVRSFCYLDRDGIPIAPEARTEGDRLANLLRKVAKLR